MKRILFCIVLSACIQVAILGALDYGIDFENTSTHLTEEAGFTFAQRNTATAWLSGTSEDWQFKVAGLYKFAGDYQADSSIVVPYRFDISNAYLQLLLPGVLGDNIMTNIQFGRFGFSDNSQRILSGTADGATARFISGLLESSVQLGYTGLQYRKDANVVITESDLADTNNPEKYFAPGRIFGAGRLKFLELVERHDLGIDVVGQFDLRSGDWAHTFYAEVFGEGRPLQWFKWRSYLIGQLWVDDLVQPAMAAGARFQFTFPAVLGLILVQNTEWASGTGGDLRQFAGINQTPVARILPLAFGDVISASLNAQIRPARGVTLSLVGNGLFRASSSVPADSLGMPVGASSRYVGTELTGQFDWTISSEFKWGLSGGAFFPNTAEDAYTASAKIRTLAALEAVFEL